MKTTNAMNEMDMIKEREIAKLLDEGKVVVIGAEKGAVVVEIEEKKFMMN